MKYLLQYTLISGFSFTSSGTSWAEITSPILNLNFLGWGRFTVLSGPWGDSSFLRSRSSTRCRLRRSDPLAPSHSAIAAPLSNTSRALRSVSSVIWPSFHWMSAKTSRNTGRSSSLSCSSFQTRAAASSGVCPSYSCS